MERVRAGRCEVANPYRRDQRSLVSLLAEDVDCFVFWTRAPAGLLPHLAELRGRGHRWYFLYTLLDYPSAFEPHAPPFARRIELLHLAAGETPRGGVVWRYDPVILSSATPETFHVETFSRLAEALHGVVDRVVVSFLDRYRKTDRGLALLEREGIHVASEADHAAAGPALLSRLAAVAREHGMDIRSCAEAADPSASGVLPGKCVDDDLIRRLYGITVSSAKDPGQRGPCRCVSSRDIGAYDTCLHGCRYCYATSSHERALAAHRRHRIGSVALDAAAPGEAS
jgi:hypothetical protein